MTKPINVSSNWTLFLKIFFPIFWGVFFGALTIAFWISDSSMVGEMSIGSFRLLISSFFLSGMIVFYFSLMQLKRVEVDDQFVYVTNYKKTARYPFHNIEKLESSNYYLFKIVRISFRKEGIFGPGVVFLANSFRLQEVLEKRKELSVIYN